MRNKLIVVMCIAMVLVSCSKKNSTIAEGIPPAKGPQARPFTGSMSYAPASGDYLPCDCGSYKAMGTFVGTGHLSYLGNTYSMVKPCLAPIISKGNYIGDHVGVECAYFQAADGDLLYCHTHPYDVYLTPSGAIGIAKVDFVGGTGRFLNAKGSFSGTVTVGPSGATFSDINGTIIY